MRAATAVAARQPNTNSTTSQPGIAHSASRAYARYVARAARAEAARGVARGPRGAARARRRCRRRGTTTRAATAATRRTRCRATAKKLDAREPQARRRATTRSPSTASSNIGRCANACASTTATANMRRERDERLHDEHREQRAGVARHRARPPAATRSREPSRSRHHGPTSCISGLRPRRDPRRRRAATRAPSPSSRYVVLRSASRARACRRDRAAPRRAARRARPRTASTSPPPRSSHVRALRRAVGEPQLDVDRHVDRAGVLDDDLAHPRAGVGRLGLGHGLLRAVPSPNTPRGSCVRPARRAAHRERRAPPTSWNTGPKNHVRSWPSSLLERRRTGRARSGA